MHTRACTHTCKRCTHTHNTHAPNVLSTLQITVTGRIRHPRGDKGAWGGAEPSKMPPTPHFTVQPGQALSSTLGPADTRTPSAQRPCPSRSPRSKVAGTQCDTLRQTGTESSPNWARDVRPRAWEDMAGTAWGGRGGGSGHCPPGRGGCRWIPTAPPHPSTSPLLLGTPEGPHQSRGSPVHPKQGSSHPSITASTVPELNDLVLSSHLTSRKDQRGKGTFLVLHSMREASRTEPGGQSHDCGSGAPPALDSGLTVPPWPTSFFTAVPS